MELKQYLTILWRWAWLILIGTLLAAATAYIASLFIRPVYAASTTLLINQAPSDKVTDYNALITSERLARTYVEMLTTRPVLDEAIQTLNLGLTSESLAAMVKVTYVRDTQLISVEVENEDPALAANLADLIPEIFRRQNSELQTSRYAESKASLGQQLTALDQQVQQTQTKIDALGAPGDASEQAELTRLQSEMAQLRQSYANVLQSYENIRLAEAQSTSNILVVEPAQTPTEPVRPKPLLNTALAAVVGLMLAVGLVFLIEYLDDSIRSPDQARELLGAPVLAGIARTALSQSGPLVLARPRSPEAEAFRSIRTNIQFASVDRPIKTILVTSAGPGEGKSTVAANLATVMAQAGLRVVIVDADLRRPSLHRQFGRPNRNGLTDLMLHGIGGWNSAVQETAARNLSLVTSGPLPPNPADLLGSQRMQQLLEHLGKSNDMIIVDTPPTLAATDALVLAPHTDAVLIVVDTGATRIRTATQLRTQFEQVGVKIMGVVMNKIALDRGGGYYYHYYYYQYGQGGTDKRFKHRSPWWWPWGKRAHQPAPAETPARLASSPVSPEDATPPE